MTALPITRLSIFNFRNIQQATLAASSRINIIYGANGSGKTSVLEAIYYLGFGRSCRSRLVEHIIQKEQDAFALSATLQTNPHQQTLGIERRRDGSRRIHLNGEPTKNILPLAQLLPLQLMNTHSYRFFYDGRKIRRQFLDWGVFHVEPRFYLAWQRVEQLLKQRNAALKAGDSLHALSIWDQELLALSDAIDGYRKDYITTLTPIAQALMQRLIGKYAFTIQYDRGWDPEKTLAEVFQDHFYRDRKIGYTQHGPQRADLQVLADNTPAQDHLSQGQQKLAAYALQIAQGVLLKEKTGISPLYLVDDLPSELDSGKRRTLANELLALDTQIFITGIALNDMSDLFNSEPLALFHVKQGSVLRADVSRETLA